jgi:hypothetical protein
MRATALRSKISRISKEIELGDSIIRTFRFRPESDRRLLNGSTAFLSRKILQASSFSTHISGKDIKISWFPCLSGILPSSRRRWCPSPILPIPDGCIISDHANSKSVSSSRQMTLMRFSQLLTRMTNSRYWQQEMHLDDKSLEGENH